VAANVSEEMIASVFRTEALLCLQNNPNHEDGGDTFFQNVGNHLVGDSPGKRSTDFSLVETMNQ
jgi:hypothetical protein